MKTIEKKEPYLHILNTRGNIYEEFLPDQVLTHKNLNKIVNYFEDQDRMSRIYLTGVGIGCGLDIVSFSNSHIEIGQGVGITTDGDIIKSETRRFQYYVALTDKADYDLFKQGDMKVYEIYEKESAGRPEDELPLNSFNANERTTLKDCIVIAYVETYTEDEGLCGGSGCDETGNKVFNNLKFLLTHKNNKELLVDADTIYKSHDVVSYYDSLPDLCLPRIKIVKEANKSLTGIQIINKYKESFLLKDDLYIGISTIIRNFSQRINFQKYGVFVSEIATYLDTIFSTLDDEHVQYRYDVLRDLIETYREIKEHILHCKFECVPNIKAFPKHLLLGTPETTTRLTTRHAFYPSPTVSENDENLMAIRTLCIKFFYQLKDFFILDAQSAQIKITPSKTYDYLLSQRTIPYYYKGGRSLVNNWNPKSNQNRKSNYQLGYNTTNLKDLDCIKNPLDYNHLDKDFYRIEGHQGKNFVTALGSIIKKKTQYSLPFDVKAISIGFPVNTISLDEDTCETKEYKTLLKTWEEEYNCVFTKAIDFFRRYQTGTLGDNDVAAPVHTVPVAENDKEDAEAIVGMNDDDKDVQDVENVKNVTSFTKNIAVALTASEDEKSASRTMYDYQYLKGLVDEDKKAAAFGVKTGYSSNTAYSYSIGKIAERMVANINVENLTADYVVAQTVASMFRINNAIDTDSDDFKLYFEIPLRVITHLQIVKYRFITSLKDVYNTERWTAFHNAFAALCREVEKILFTLADTTERGTFGTKVHDKMYEYLIEKIAGLCCLKEKFNWLKTQLDEIRFSLYRELVLADFIKQHPGLEHMAGVPKGGTFVMVYIGDQPTNGEDDALSDTDFERKVLFDFALPYMCKAECAPDTIVYSDVVDPVTLAIARKKYCLPADSDQVDFIIEPERGVVTSPDGTAFIITTARGYAFDPTKVPDELLGEGIQFLVDGKIPTIPLETVVYKLPQNVTATYELVAWTADGLVINLNVTHELEDLLYLQHAWKRTNGSEIALGKNPTNILILTEENLFQENIIVTIDVIGNPVPCKLEIPVAVDEEREIIEVDVDMATEICYNPIETTPIPEIITVTPTDGTLTSPQIPQNGQSFIEEFNGEYSLNPLFVPENLAGEPITFVVNGIPVENFETRVYFIPGNITTNAEVISWDENGVNIKMSASHDFDTKTYLTYEWLNENDQIISNARESIMRFDAVDGVVNVTLRVRVRVNGSDNQLCASAEFPLVIEEARPEVTVTIPPAICWAQGQELEPIPIEVSTTDVELRCPIEDEIGVQLLLGEPGNYAFEIMALPNELIGTPITFEIDGAQVASTTVYVIPETVEASYDNVVWDGNKLVIDLVATHSLEGEIERIEDYLHYSWKNENEEVVLEEKQRINFEILTENGSISENYTLTVKVREELIENPCGSEAVSMVIEENRPNVTVTIAPEICFIETENGTAATYPIVVNPSSFSISSPDGSAFIEGGVGSYRLNPQNVPAELLGQPIRFVADGEVKATTKVYKLPELVQRNISVTNENWVSGGLQVTLTSDIISRNYYKYEWFVQTDGVDVLLDKVAEPNTYLIPDNGDGVNVEVFLRLSAETEGISCVQDTLKTQIIRHRTISVSKDRFCIPDTPVIFRGINTDTGDLQSVTTLPSNVITQNDGKYQFNPNNVPENLWGTSLRFKVNNITQSTVVIKVYKTPSSDSIVHDVQASQWVTGGYEFVFTHELINKSYFTYQVILKSTGEELQSVRAHTYLIPTQENSIAADVVVVARISGVACQANNTIEVRSTRPDEPSQRLTCEIPFNSRLQILDTGTMLANIKQVVQRQSFESSLLSDVLNPLDQIIMNILAANDPYTLTKQTVEGINFLRKELMSKYYNNSSIDKGFNKTFLELDEIMEIIVLELLRCTPSSDDNLFNSTDIFFNDSTAINSEYVEQFRHTIDSKYVSDFNPKISSFKLKVDATFNATKKR